MRKNNDKKTLPVRVSRSDVQKYNNEPAGEQRVRKIGFDFGYLLSAFLTIAVAFISVGAVIYFGYHLINAFKSDVTYAPAYLIEEIEYRRGVGYIFRDEAIILKSQRKK